MTELWIDANWIRDRLQATMRTQKALSAALGLDPSAVSRLLDGSRQLKADEIPKVIAFFDPTRFGAESNGTVASAHQRPQNDSIAKSRSGGRVGPGPQPKRSFLPDMAILGPLRPEGSTYYILESGVAERRPPPPQLRGVPGAYGLFMPDNRLAPRYRAGEILYIHPAKPILSGFFVVVRFRQPVGRVAIGEIVNMDDGTIILMLGALNGRQIPDLTIVRDEIGQVGRIVVAATE